MAFRIGIDTGGTFTDLAVVDENGDFRMYKSPTTPDDYTEGILNTLRLCAADHNLKLRDFFAQVDAFVVHGSTVATNAIIEGNGAKVGIIGTKGHTSILWRREGNRQDVFNYYVEYPRPLVAPYLCRGIEERINSEGEVEIPLNEESVRAAVRVLKELNVEAIGVCLLWSVVNNAHEQRVATIIEEEWPGIPISVSSQLQPVIREYNRTACVAFDAMLKPLMTRYAKNFKERLSEEGFSKEVLMVVSSGGILSASEAVAKPVYMLFSGPAMGPVAGAYYAQLEGYNNWVTVDMGGTSFDVSTATDGVTAMTRDARVGVDPTGITSVEVITLGAGGGSIASVDHGGLLHVGPQSAGARPGPACYQFGGRHPTVTDANVVLGYIDPEYFLGGTMKISAELAREAIEREIACKLKLSVEDAAKGIYQVVNANMVGGILDMTVRRGIDPREYLLVAGGGAGALHAIRLARELNMKKVVIPKTAPVLCALGMLNADITFTYVGSKYTDSQSFDAEGINTLLAELQSKAVDAMDREGIPLENRRFEFYAAARYPMEVSEIDIPLRENRVTPSMLSDLVADFHALHEKRYAVIDPHSHVEFTDWRVVGISITPELTINSTPFAGTDASAAIRGTRRASFPEAGGFIETPVYDGNKFGYGMVIEGPAIIEDMLTTTVVIPVSRLTVSSIGSYIVTFDSNPELRSMTE